MSDIITKPLPYRVDLAETIKKTYLDTLFATQDNEAHRFELSLFRDKAQLALPSSATVSAYFIRYSDNATIDLDGEASGNVVSVTLKKSCYNKPGQFALIIKVLDGDVISTVFYGEGTIFASNTDTILDEENVVPSLEDLLAQIERMETATKAANTATSNANTATTKADNAATQATNAATTANTAAQNANTAAEAANAAAKAWGDETAADSEKLGGVDASEYAQKGQMWKHIRNSAGAVNHLLAVAASYFPHKDDFVYGNWNTAINTECVQVDGKWEIDCSSFVTLALMGVPFENSRYNGNASNIPLAGYVFDEINPVTEARPYGFLASHLAKYAADNGFLFPIDDIRLVEPGDVLFSANSTEGTYLDIGHCAIAMDVDKHDTAKAISVFEVKETTFVDGNHGIGTGNGKSAYAARFPLTDRLHIPNNIVDPWMTFPQAVEMTMTATSTALFYIPLTEDIQANDIITVAVRTDSVLPGNCRFAIGGNFNDDGSFTQKFPFKNAPGSRLHLCTFRAPNAYTQAIYTFPEDSVRRPVLQLRMYNGENGQELNFNVTGIEIYTGYVNPSWK